MLVHGVYMDLKVLYGLKKENRSIKCTRGNSILDFIVMEI